VSLISRAKPGLLDPPVEDGRRCLDAKELRAAGMELDRYGRWSITTDAERIREAFSGVRSPTQRPAEVELVV
jgi:hypothetical protein